MQVLHKLDNKAILVSASSSILDTFIFYAGLIFSARIIDDLLLQMWKKAALHTVFLIVFNLALGVLKNQISKIFFQKYQMLYTDLKILTRKKVLSMSFQQFENPEITKKIYLSERTMDMYGGLDEVLYLYQQLFHSIIFRNNCCWYGYSYVLYTGRTRKWKYNCVRGKFFDGSMFDYESNNFF